ncbi:hypothetical protein GQ457_17G013090 [Hibiscus cannabinus]
MGRKCPVVSHLMFADDCVLFTKANQANCESVKHILHSFQSATGQMVNWGKSSVFFSSNISVNAKSHLTNVLGFSPMEKGSKYLGLPSV